MKCINILVSCFRFFLFEEDSREVTFIASSNFHNHCILKVTHVNHKSERLTSALVLSAATDGRVAFWDVTDLCQSIVDDIMNDKTSKTGDRKSNSDISVFLEKRVQSQHTLSTCDFGSDSNSSTAADYVKESNAGDPSCEKEGQRSCEKKGQRSEVVPAAWLDCHQSGVNSIYLDKYEGNKNEPCHEKSAFGVVCLGKICSATEAGKSHGTTNTAI